MAPFSAKNSCRVELSVSEKLEVVSYAKIHGYREAAAHFGIGETTAFLLERNENKYKELNEVNKKMGSFRMRRFKRTKIHSINVKTWEWLKELIERGEPISDKIIRGKALSIAHDESVLNFSASNGWLVAFKKRHGVRLRRTSSSSSHAHANNNFEPSINPFTNEKVAVKGPSSAVSSNAKLGYLPHKSFSRWIRIFPHELLEDNSPEKKGSQTFPSPQEGSHLMDPRYYSELSC